MSHIQNRTELKSLIESNCLDSNGKLHAVKTTKFLVGDLLALLFNLSGCRSDTLVEHVRWILSDRSSYNRCLVCGADVTKFYPGIKAGYKDHCSMKCAKNDKTNKAKVVASNRKKYGVDHPIQTSEVRQKIKKSIEENDSYSKMVDTFEQRYGTRSNFGRHSVVEKIKNTFETKYGVSNPSQVEDIKLKRADSNQIRYGSVSPFGNEEVRKKIIETHQARRGVSNPMNDSVVVEKAKSTNLEVYGFTTASQHQEVKQKTAESNLKKYGYSHPMKNEEIRETARFSYRKKYLPGKIESMANIVAPLFSINDYTNTKKLYKWKCVKCSNEFEGYIANGQIPICRVCHPITVGSSKAEKEIVEYVESIIDGSISNDRRTLNGYKVGGYELDLYLPEKKIAIEFNGLYWHSDFFKSKNYHLDKTEACAKLGIQLIHVFEDEWTFKQEIVKSRLASIVGKTKKVYGRECSVELINKPEADSFMATNHIQGDCWHSVAFGLKYSGETVAMMTFGRPRFDRTAEVELIRYASKLGQTVVGGASKLLKAFVSAKKPRSIISYCDLRWSVGNLYEKLGFKRIRQTKPGFSYVDFNSQSRLNRMRFQKHKLSKTLEVYDEKLTESENMYANGYGRIWDCGQLVYLLL